MSAHTPGPWTYQEQAGRYFINGVAYYNLAVTSNEANARLIAAAPRMLALLEHVPHDHKKPTLHKMIEHVHGCPGCEARAILLDVEGDHA